MCTLDMFAGILRQHMKTSTFDTNFVSILIVAITNSRQMSIV